MMMMMMMMMMVMMMLCKFSELVGGANEFTQLELQFAQQ
jgi:hypothetical protein